MVRKRNKGKEAYISRTRKHEEKDMGQHTWTLSSKNTDEALSHSNPTNRVFFFAYSDRLIGRGYLACWKIFTVSPALIPLRLCNHQRFWVGGRLRLSCIGLEASVLSKRL